MYVGASGFSYPGWKGTFYPEGLRSEDFLAHYSRSLNSVEINSSFYGSPSASTVKGWEGRTPGEFKFAFKAPRQITHVLKLGEGAPEAAERLSRVLGPLGPRRGPVLFQLPPFAKLNLDRLEGFLKKTSGVEGRVFEFRHESWFNDATYELLDRHGAGFCVAETEDLAPVLKVTGRLAYFRLRKDSYDVEAVDRWAERILGLAGSAPECYAFLRHDETGANALLAQRLYQKVGGA